MKKTKFYFLLVLFIFSILFLIYPDDAVGVIVYFEGDLIHKFKGQKESISLGTVVYKKSIIDYKNKKGKAAVDILTLNGKKLIGKFPVRDFSNLDVMDEKTKKYFVDHICGKIIMREHGSIFEWDMDVGALTEEDIAKNDFKIIFNSRRSSHKINKYNPLILKFKDKSKVVSASYSIERSDGIVISKGKMDKINNEFVFNFKNVEYKTGQTYIVTCDFLLKNKEELQYKFHFKIYDNEMLEFIENEINNILTEYKTDFQKSMIRAAVYDKYNLYLKKMEILNNNEIRIK